MTNVAAALFIGFIIACAVLFMALFGGSQADVGYDTWDDIGSDPIDTGYNDYDIENTYMQLYVPLMVDEMGITSPTSFRG